VDHQCPLWILDSGNCKSVFFIGADKKNPEALATEFPPLKDFS
jgi:hypothetical protein